MVIPLVKIVREKGLFMIVGKLGFEAVTMVGNHEKSYSSMIEGI